MASSTPSSQQQQQQQLQCRVLDESHIEACSKVMAQAFSDSPAYKYMLQDMTSQQRTELLEWLFDRNLRLTMSKCPTVLRGIVDKEDDSKKIVCCFLWTPSPHHDHSTWEMIKAGLWQLPYRCGSLASLKRLFAVIEATEEDTRQVEYEQFVQLERMAVRPDRQGEGIGTKALKQTFEEHFAKEGEKAMPVRLSTQEERNVRFYRDRLGCEVVLETKKFEEDAEFGYQNWFLVKKDNNNGN